MTIETSAASRPPSRGTGGCGSSGYGAARVPAGDMPWPLPPNGSGNGPPGHCPRAEIAATLVSMGNPHAVHFLADVGNFKLCDIGPRVETMTFSPAG